MLVRIFVPWIILAAVLGFALGGSYVALGQTPSEQQTHRPRDNQGPAASKPSAIPQSHAQQEGANTDGGEHAVKEHVLEFFNVKLTDLLIAIFTIVLAWRTSGLFKETAGLRSAAEQQALDMKAAIAASEKAANAATSQAETAARTLADLERPYVYVSNLSPVMRGDNRDEYFVEYEVANYGKTPAILEAVSVGFETDPNGKIAVPPFVWDGHPLDAARILAAGERRGKLREYIGPDHITTDIEVVLDPDAPNPRLPVFKLKRNESQFFRVVIRYRGPFTRNHEVGAMWRYTGNGIFAPRGDSEYNYQR
jgi:hypothetical protein